jgi:hypothetical protein
MRTTLGHTMQRRPTALAAIAVAALTTASGAGAVAGRIAVTPSSVVSGGKTTIAVKVSARSGERLPTALFLKVTSPKGGTFRVRLSRKAPGTWRTTFVFFDKGQWRLRVVAGSGGTPKAGSLLASSSVVVRKP